MSPECRGTVHVGDTDVSGKRPAPKAGHDTRTGTAVCRSRHSPPPVQAQAFRALFQTGQGPDGTVQDPCRRTWLNAAGASGRRCCPIRPSGRGALAGATVARPWPGSRRHCSPRLGRPGFVSRPMCCTMAPHASPGVTGLPTAWSLRTSLAGPRSCGEGRTPAGRTGRHQELPGDGGCRMIMTGRLRFLPGAGSGCFLAGEL